MSCFALYLILNTYCRALAEPLAILYLRVACLYNLPCHITRGDYLHVTQVHTLEGTLSQEQESHAETTQQLKGDREMLAAADANKRQFEAQIADLQAQQADSQAALQSAQEKLTASETELAQAGQDAKQLQQQVQTATTKTCSRTYGLHSLRHHSMCAILTECRSQSVNHEFSVPVFNALEHFQ